MSGITRFLRQWWIGILIVLIIAAGFITTRIPSDPVSEAEFDALISSGTPLIVEVMQNG